MIENPIEYDLAAENENYKYESKREVLYTQGHKVAYRPQGFVSMNKGCHAVTHFGACKILRKTEVIKIYHIPYLYV